MIRLLIVASMSLTITAYAQERPRAAIPEHYSLQSRCVPGRGFVASPEAPGHPRTLPFVLLYVFKGEVTAVLFEVHERDGWKPWYDQPQGEPISHHGGPKHYTQLIRLRPTPSAEQCAGAKSGYES